MTLHLSVTAFIVSLRHDIQTIMYTEIGKMHITDPVRDLLAFIGNSAETKSVSAVVWDIRVVLLAKFGHVQSLYL